MRAKSLCPSNHLPPTIFIVEPLRIADTLRPAAWTGKENVLKFGLRPRVPITMLRSAGRPSIGKITKLMPPYAPESGLEGRIYQSSERNSTGGAEFLGLLRLPIALPLRDNDHLQNQKDR